MATKKYDLAVKTGSYEKNGETKNRYENIGAVWQGENGPYITLKASFNHAGVPRRDGGDRILVACFDTSDQDGNRQAGRRQHRRHSAPPREHQLEPGKHLHC